MRYLHDRPIITNMDVQPVRIMVHGHHISLLYNTVLFREIFLCKSLQISAMC